MGPPDHASVGAPPHGVHGPLCTQPDPGSGPLHHRPQQDHLGGRCVGQGGGGPWAQGGGGPDAILVSLVFLSLHVFLVTIGCLGIT